jgi:hypothetical protein
VLSARRILPLTCAVLLALPGTALAGGAGDDQYQDPFADEPAQSQQPAQQAPAEASPAPAAPAQGSGPAAPAAAPSALPRTGPDAGLTALGGGALLLAGLALRRRTADAARS